MASGTGQCQASMAMGSARERALRERRTKEIERIELDEGDVPAAVVCAFCGDADCTGCSLERSRSGVVSIVSWERSGLPMWTRLWATARATTREPEGFFGTLPDGPLAPAFRFALLSETLAASAMLMLWVPVAAIVAPLWLRHVALDGETRSLALRILLLAIPGLALLLVSAHAAHGLALDRGARKSGAPSSRRRALRFGLYATGWDLVIGPLGAIVVAFKEGFGSALSLTTAAVGLPTTSAKAFLRSVYRLDGAGARRALSASYVAAVVATVVGAIAILGAIIGLALL
jgi:hypothetical protein